MEPGNWVMGYLSYLFFDLIIGSLGDHCDPVRDPVFKTFKCENAMSTHVLICGRNCPLDVIQISKYKSIIIRNID